MRAGPCDLALAMGERVRAFREERKMNMLALARKADVAPSQVMCIEAGIHSAKVRSVKPIADALGVRLSDILNAKDNDLGVIYEALRNCSPEMVKKLRIDLSRCMP